VLALGNNAGPRRRTTPIRPGSAEGRPANRPPTPISGTPGCPPSAAPRASPIAEGSHTGAGPRQQRWPSMLGAGPRRWRLALDAGGGRSMLGAGPRHRRRALDAGGRPSTRNAGPRSGRWPSAPRGQLDTAVGDRTERPARPPRGRDSLRSSRAGTL